MTAGVGFGTCGEKGSTTEYYAISFEAQASPVAALPDSDSVEIKSKGHQKESTGESGGTKSGREKQEISQPSFKQRGVLFEVLALLSFLDLLFCNESMPGTLR